MSKKLVIYTAMEIISISLLVYSGAAGPMPKIFHFNRKDALNEWKEKIFHGRVIYEVKAVPGQNYLSADSNKACSGIFYNIQFDPRKFPYISWAWKVSRFPTTLPADTFTKKTWIEKDDYALRVYVIFPAFIFTNSECLEYVWAQDLPKGAIITSPFFKNIKLIVVESGAENKNKWVKVERNIARDYYEAFGRPLRRQAGAIALMTDSDNTQSRALGYYTDIKVGYGKSTPGQGL